MFTQRISMDCTKEQYEKYLKDDLLKMGYREVSWQNSLSGAIVNNFADNLGDISNVHESDALAHNRTYLGSFNAPLFLALAAMTDEKYGRYGEYWVFEGEGCAPEFICGNLYKAIAPINKVWCFIDEMGDENSFSENEKYFRKATVSEIVQKFGDGFGEKFGEPKQERDVIVNVICGFDGNKFGQPKGEKRIDILFQHCIFLERGLYYYCKTKEDGSEWVFISSGEEPKSSHLACACLNDDYVRIAEDARITNDNDISLIRVATDLEKRLLDNRIARQGKYFDKEKCKIMPIVEKCSDLTEATVQDLLRGIERNISDYIWSPCQEKAEELEAILLLKSKGYKIFEKKEAWGEV